MQPSSELTDAPGCHDCVNLDMHLWAVIKQDGKSTWRALLYVHGVRLDS